MPLKQLFLIIILFQLSCSSNEDGPNRNINFSIIGQGQLYGNGIENIEKSNLIIENATSWNDLIDRMNTTNNVSGNFTETDINFSQFQIIAVFDKIYNTGGHSIDIIQIAENERHLMVKIGNLLTGNDSQVLTQPFQIVKIPKTEKEIIFN